MFHSQKKKAYLIGVVIGIKTHSWVHEYRCTHKDINRVWVSNFISGHPQFENMFEYMSPKS